LEVLAPKLAEVLPFPFPLTSPNAIPPHQVVLSFLAGVLAEARCIAHVWLWSGNTAAARDVPAFLAEVLALLVISVPVTLVRADSGFFEEAVLLVLEAATLPNAIAARGRELFWSPGYPVPRHSFDHARRTPRRHLTHLQRPGR
jgi:hypothetical protein